jgi:hypothetical protein
MEANAINVVGEWCDPQEPGVTACFKLQLQPVNRLTGEPSTCALQFSALQIVLFYCFNKALLQAAPVLIGTGTHTNVTAARCIYRSSPVMFPSFHTKRTLYTVHCALYTVHCIYVLRMIINLNTALSNWHMKKKQRVDCRHAQILHNKKKLWTISNSRRQQGEIQQFARWGCADMGRSGVRDLCTPGQCAAAFNVRRQLMCGGS